MGYLYLFHAIWPFIKILEPLVCYYPRQQLVVLVWSREVHVNKLRDEQRREEIVETEDLGRDRPGPCQTIE